MGRHATPAPDAEPGRRPGTVARLARTLLRVGVLAATAFAATALAVAWAGNRWSTAALAGLGAALVVALATALAATVPTPPGGPNAPGEPDGEDHRRAEGHGPHAIQ